MNLLHLLSEPDWFEIMLAIACFAMAVMLIWLIYKANQETDDASINKLDELERLIEQHNKHCRIKADYDCEG